MVSNGGNGALAEYGNPRPSCYRRLTPVGSVRMRKWMVALLSVASVWSAPAAADPIAPSQSWYDLVSSNGQTGVVVDARTGVVHHLREHLYAAEEPRWQADGSELWLATTPGGTCYQPQVVYSRDVLRDAYFGVQARGRSQWLNSAPADLDATGYDSLPGHPDLPGGTPIVRVEQTPDGMEVATRTRVFAPWSLDAKSFVMLLEVENLGTTATGPVRAYALVNPNLGFGRPGPRSEIGAEFETVSARADGSLLEQGFAGMVLSQPIVPASRTTHSPAAFYEAVNTNAGDLPLPGVASSLADGSSGAFQWDIADIPPGESAWVGLLVNYNPDPDAVVATADRGTAWLAGRSAAQVWLDERDLWQTFQDGVSVPAGMSAQDEAVFRQSATILRTAQVRERSTFLRPEVDRGVTRYTGVDDAVTAVAPPGVERNHKGYGAVLASLPPGQWAYPWVRDGAYAIVGMSDAGMFGEARDALGFYLNADADRYRLYSELASVPLRPYALSLTRYYGFGLEESDTTCNGDFNFEWDGFGLYAWALKHYADQSGDIAFVRDHWPQVRDGVGDVIEGLVEPATGVMWGDSSIWEVHWLDFKAKRFTYTSLTAARGLCDLGDLAEQLGETADAERYRLAGRALRQSIYRNMRDPSGALAANIEELQTGGGYWDASVVDAISFGLFSPDGPTSTATLAALRAQLTVPSGRGLFRNDDLTDTHALSPYGSDYDTVEWVFLDLRASIAARRMALPDYANFLQDWVGDQTRSNFMLVGETYDQSSGAYRNNAPMIGFGSGSWISAMWQRYGGRQDAPACGVYFEDDPLYGPDAPSDDTGVDAGDDVADTDPADAGADTEVADTDPADAGADTEVADTEPADTGTDTEVADTEPVDTEVADTVADATVDTEVADTGADSALTDSARDTTPDTIQGGADTSRSDPTASSSGCSSTSGAGALWQLALVGAAVLRRRKR